MPFLGGALGPVLGGIGSLFGGILGKSAGNLNNYQKQAYNLLNYNAQQASPFARNFGNTGMGFLNQARGTLAGPQNYFQQLLSGNQAATTQALAPDINRIRAQNQGILQSTSSLAPRGAGRSGELFNLPFQTSSNISGLYNQARPTAAQGLTQIGGLQGQLGLGAGGLGANFLNSGNYASGLMGGMGTQGYNQQLGAGGALGGMFGNILQQLPWGKWFPGSGGGGGGGFNYGPAGPPPSGGGGGYG